MKYLLGLSFLLAFSACTNLSSTDRHSSTYAKDCAAGCAHIQDVCMKSFGGGCGLENEPVQCASCKHNFKGCSKRCSK